MRGSEGDGAPPALLHMSYPRTTGYYLIILITCLKCIDQMAILMYVCVCVFIGVGVCVFVEEW